MAVTLGGNPIEVSGTFPKVGDTAPDFRLVNKDLADVSLADVAGKKKILNIVPSLDTPVCAISTKKFNDAAVGSLHEFSGFPEVVEWEEAYLPEEEMDKYEGTLGADVGND